MFFKVNMLGVFWTLIIIGVCIIPGGNLSQTSFLGSIGVDKMIHALFYLVLVNLVARGLMQYSTTIFPKTKAIFIAFFYSLVLGISVEYLQFAYVNGRTGDVFDILANNIGAIIGVFIVMKSKLTQKMETK